VTPNPALAAGGRETNGRDSLAWRRRSRPQLKRRSLGSTRDIPCHQGTNLLSGRIWGPGGYILGTIFGGIVGSSAYWRVRGLGDVARKREISARIAAGVAAAIASSAIYIPLGVHVWVAEDWGNWKLSAFLGVCMGICQGVLFRGTLFPPQGPPSSRSM
jgi:hypothetical protein